jgi:adenine-specific DNA-methyltransferase
MKINDIHSKGQYFTTNDELKKNVFKFIKNKPLVILEPSIGQGDIIKYISGNIPDVLFDMYEIDEEIKLLDGIIRKEVIYGDFMKQKLNKLYKTIIGNPPYVKMKSGNLYLHFIEKCYYLLEENGELIFIVPSDFFKLTSSAKIMNIMMDNGTFTHIYHPHKENLFENASIDVLVFRYCKDPKLDNTIEYNENMQYITNSNGLITFDDGNNINGCLIQEQFDVFVGVVSGKEDVFKNNMGNIEILNGENKLEKYICIKKFPCENNEINDYLFQHKQELIERGIRKFTEKNWFEFGLLRNLTAIVENKGKDCIYVKNLTRNSVVAFQGKVGYFGGGLLMLFPKSNCNLSNVVKYLNSGVFKSNFLFSGRFKIGQRQLCNSSIPIENL